MNSCWFSTCHLFSRFSPKRSVCFGYTVIQAKAHPALEQMCSGVVPWPLSSFCGFHSRYTATLDLPCKEEPDSHWPFIVFFLFPVLLAQVLWPYLRFSLTLKLQEDRCHTLEASRARVQVLQPPCHGKHCSLPLLRSV